MSESSLRLVPLAPDRALGSRLPLEPDTTLDTVTAWIVAARVFSPWMLVAPASHVPLAAAAAARVLSGELPAFGLLGAVVEGPADAGPLTDLGLMVETGDDAVTRLGGRIRAHAPEVPDDWGRLIASSRVAPGVRATLARRALPDDPGYVPRVLSDEQLALLRRITARLVPQEAPAIDLAARTDAMLAAGEGDGWRPAGAPSDAEAYRRGLDVLAEVWPDDERAGDDPVTRLVDGDGMDEQLTAWFEDLRNDAIRLWLSHPASFARVGYTGFAAGAAEPEGYRVLAAGEREEWEPADVGRLAPAGGMS